MPVYTYRFKDGHTTEVTHSITEDARTELVNPFTGLIEPVERIIAPRTMGIALNGEGWTPRNLERK